MPFYDVSKPMGYVVTWIQQCLTTFVAGSVYIIVNTAYIGCAWYVEGIVEDIESIFDELDNEIAHSNRNKEINRLLREILQLHARMMR